MLSKRFFSLDTKEPPIDATTDCEIADVAGDTTSEIFDIVPPTSIALSVPNKSAPNIALTAESPIKFVTETAFKQSLLYVSIKFSIRVHPNCFI